MAVLEAETNEILSLISKFGVPVETKIVDNQLHIDANGVEVVLNQLELKDAMVKLHKMNGLKVNLKKVYISPAVSNVEFSII